MAETASDITELLRQVAGGDRAAEGTLFTVVYSDLRRLARRAFQREANRHTLQTTAIVHEAYIRLARSERVSFADRAHFFAIAATVMRRILVDHARAKHAAKRGMPTVELDGFDPAMHADDPAVILAVDTALLRLRDIDPRQSQIVELRFFAGMTAPEIASALTISERTVKREWRLARAWLYGELRP